MKLNFFYIILIAVLLSIAPKVSVAQLPDLPPETTDVPIDGGLSLLAAAGVAYGAKKANDKRRKKQEENSSTLDK